MQAQRTQVAIVGGGPVGLTAALLLDSYGIRCRVLERRSGLHRAPQAHVINTRTMEILRSLGVDREVMKQAAPLTRLRCITWCETLAGREFGRISLMGSDPAAAMARLRVSPTLTVNLAQSLLEPMLLARLRQASRARVSFDSEVVAVEQQQGGTTLRIRDGSTGLEETLAADYVLACDGATSLFRAEAGIDMQGPPSLQTFMTIYFRADLGRYLADRPGPLYWIGGRDVHGVFLGFDIATTWAFMFPYADPQTPADFPLPVAAELLRRAIGDPRASFEITSIGNWNMSAQVADRYRSGRLFLVGDAAHRFPPSGGLGMNTGIQDAHNLAWKLAAVLDGKAGDSLLDSYQSERRPVAERNCEQSLTNAMRLMEVDQALGIQSFTPLQPSAADGPWPSPMDLGLDGDSQDAIARREQVARAIADQREHFDFVGLDLGFSYEDGAVVADGSPPPPPTSISTYHPSTRPGGRLPHVWLQTAAGARVSTLDLLDPAGPGRFTLLVGADGGAWADAASTLTAAAALPLGLVRIAPIAEGGDAVDPDGEWRALSGIDDDGAILVRPDGHVAWRSRTGVADARTTLQRALDEILGAPAPASRPAVTAEAPTTTEEPTMKPEPAATRPAAAARGTAPADAAHTPTLGSAAPGSVHPVKLAHLVFRTPRYDAMVAWYCRVLEARVVFGSPMLSFLTYDDEHHRVAFVNLPFLADADPMAAGVDHVAFTYASLGDLVHTYERLAEAGILPHWCINHGPTTSLYYRDPDGNQAELQIDNFDDNEELEAWFRSGVFEKNPIGVEFDPALLARRFHEGRPLRELLTQGWAATD